ADELPLAPERQAPDEAHEQAARVVLTQQHVPHRLDELGAELGPGELPRDGGQPVIDEHLTERLRLGLEPPAEQLDLPLGEGVRMRGHSGRGPLTGGDIGADGGRHWMISASQVFFTRSARLRSSGVISTVSSAPGIIRATFCATPSMTIVVDSNSCGSSW